MWEVWSISGRGERAVTPLCGPSERDNLLVNGLGPIQKMGKRSIAVGLGNVVKVISVGTEKFDGEETTDNNTAFVGMAAATATRRKKSSMGAKKKSR